MPLAQTQFDVFAFSTSTSLPIDGDAANITADLRKDYGAFVAIADTNPSPVASKPGFYRFDLSAGERDVSLELRIFPVSSTSGVQVIGVPMFYAVQEPKLVGPFTRTITVTDSVSGDPIEGVSVRLSLAADTESQLTNASGVASFTVSAGTWSYEIFRSGYAGASGTVVVSGSGGTTVGLVANAAPPVVTAETTALTFRVSSQGNVSLAGVVASARLIGEGYKVAGSTVGINIVETATSDAGGLVTLILFRESDYDLSVQRTNGTIYKIRIRTSDGPSTIISAAIEV